MQHNRGNEEIVSKKEVKGKGVRKGQEGGRKVHLVKETLVLDGDGWYSSR